MSKRTAGTVASWVFLVVVTTFFVFPLLAMARFAFQRVPTVLLGWSTLLDKWTIGSLTRAFEDPQFGEALWLSVRLALGTIVVTLALMLPTAMWVHLRIPKARGLVETLTVLPYVVPPIALVVGVIGAYQDSAPWFFTSRFSLVPFYAVLGHAVHLPRARRRTAGDRPAHARRRFALLRRRLDDDDVPRPHPQPASVAAHVGVPHRHGGARRVHDGRTDGQADTADVHAAVRPGASHRAPSPSVS